MQKALEELIDRRTKKALAVILGMKEAEIDPLLQQVDGGRDASTRLRKVVLEVFREYRQIVTDILESVCAEQTTVLLNEQYLERLEEKIDDMYNVVVPPDARSRNGRRPRAGARG